MASVVNSFGLLGIDSFLVTVECSIHRGNVAFDLIGLPDAAIKESRERVRSALKILGENIPFSHIVVNLAPANVRKVGSTYDLPILITLLTEMGVLPETKTAMVGELSLGGDIRGVTGVLPMILEADTLGITEVIVPKENAGEGASVSGLTVYVAQTALEVVEHLRGVKKLPLAKEFLKDTPIIEHFGNLSEVKGQGTAKKALEIAAAGMHNLLMVGPPGSGKSMLAKRLPSILPPLDEKERIATTKLYSVAGLLSAQSGLVSQRPFRSPHHTISSAGLIGGGNPLKPGEISLAHNGVLFLDELPEFPQKIIESLRQPLEDGVITIARVNNRLTFPCQMMVVAAMNPCPCGYFGSSQPCRCSASTVERYLARISGPMLDRFDIHTTVAAVSFEELSTKGAGESSEEIYQRVSAAREIQRVRYQGTPYSCNSQIGRDILQEVSALRSDAKALLSRAFDQMGLSARGHDKILKLARTIADLDASGEIGAKHIAQAIQLRSLDRRIK